MEVKAVAITSLQLDPKNARKHSEANLRAIANSLTKFGQRKPIVIQGNRVLAGNGTLEAAKSLGWTEIMVADAPDEWDEQTAKAYALADNRTAELAEWDEAILANELFELQDQDWNIADIGFEPIKIPNDDAWSDSMQNVENERKPLQQMTFTLHDDQVETIKSAMEKAKSLGEYGDTGNTNNNGNALARIAEIFLGQ